MAQDYYPDFYLRKRQRERVYRGIGWGIGLLAVVGLGIFVAVIIWGNLLAPRKLQPGATPELASQRQDLETQQKLDEAAKQNLNAGTLAEQTADSQKFDLGTIDYASSFPLVQVGLGGEGGSALPAADTSADPAEGTAPTQDPASTAQQDPSAVNDIGAGTSTPAAPADKPAAKPEDKPTPEKKQETAKKPEEKKPEPKKEEKKPEVKEEKKPEAAKPAGYVYRVYAGSTSSRESAEKLKSEISSSGVSASIVQSGGDYLLLVGTLDDLDSAMALRNKLINSGFSGAFTTKKSK